MPSEFLTLLRTRFTGGDASVPWHLDDKRVAYEHAESLGIRTPKVLAVLRDIRRFRGPARQDRFVLKIAGAHSAMGVMLLERYQSGRFGREQFLDHMSLKLLTAQDVVQSQQDLVARRRMEQPYWMLEEFLDPSPTALPIPFDYKFYCFNGVPALILQIDRNSTPPKCAVFDGAWIPLKAGEDYHLDLSRWALGDPVLPASAPFLLRAAGTLAQSTNSVFVSVDMYDGPVFGEFTFAPGAPDVGMIRFSDRTLAYLDECLSRPPLRNVGEPEVDLKECSDSLPTLLAPPLLQGSQARQYKVLATRAYNGDRKACGEASNLLLRLHPRDAATRRWLQHMAVVWDLLSFTKGNVERSFPVGKGIASPEGFFTNTDEAQRFWGYALDHYRSRSDTNVWAAARLAVMTIEGQGCAPDRAAGLQLLADLAQGGYEHAQKLLLRYR
jgi:hypothetical protein